jgi:hypothetical protein
VRLYPRDAALRVLFAEDEARHGVGWAPAAELPADLCAPGDPLARHVAHLRGLGRLHAGDLAGAIETWTAAAACEGRCDLDAVIRHARILAGEAVTPVTSHDHAALARRDAAAAMAAGDAPAAVAALASRAAWRAYDRQIFARRAEAWLAIPCRDLPARLHKLVALAWFLREQAASTPSDAPGPAPLDEARLESLAAEARAWLDRFAADPDTE